MLDWKKKISMNSDLSKALGPHLLSSEKKLDIGKSVQNTQTSTLSTSTKTSEGTGFFSSYKPKTSSKGGFFSSSKNDSYISDRPAPESLSKYYDQRKNIIFGKVNIKDHEKKILKLILDSQNNANNLIKGKDPFFCCPNDIHQWMISLKENISNYCLVFYLFLQSKQNKKANELFLLMHQQNGNLLESISKEIKKNFKNMSNSNRIGKFYPTIIKVFFQLLSVIIKLSAKFNKNLIENYYLKMYIQTMRVVRDTIMVKFTSANNDLENDYKLIGRFFFYDCIYNIGIYFLYRYQPSSLIIILFQYIFEHYHEKDIIYLINSEQILLLKINYNLALLYYLEGNIGEAIVNLTQAKERLPEKIIFPYTILKDSPNQTINNSHNYANKVTTSETNNNYQERSSISSFNIDESVEKVIAGTSNKKRSISSRVSRDMMVTDKNFMPTKNVYSHIFFGKEKFIFKEQAKYINHILSQKIEIEIELFLAEIELDQKNFQEAYIHVNKILDIIRYGSKKNYKDKIQSKKMLNTDNNANSINNNTHSYYLKSSDINKNVYKNNNAIHTSFNISNIPKAKNCQTISELNRRHISYILEEIEQEYKKRNEYSNSNNDIQNLDYEYNSTKSDQYENDKRLNETIDRENKISRETEKFFIFICGLSIYQLKILNEFQPKPSAKRDDLPILFPNQFKDCLTFAQRLALNNLDTMSLSRYIILKDSNKDINPENLDYVFLTRKIKSSHKDKLELVGEAHNNDYLKNILMNLSKKNTIKSMHSDSSDCSEKNSRKNLFDKEKFQKFVEEDKVFNQKITEITHKENKAFLEMNRQKILKILHGLSPKEKELLLKSSNCFNNFLKKIERKMNKKHL
jgi:hypothetical protein